MFNIYIFKLYIYYIYRYYTLLKSTVINDYVNMNIDIANEFNIPYVNIRDAILL